MELNEFLKSAITDYDNLVETDFLNKAHQIYNAYATYPCPLPKAEHPYLLGIVFSKFAKYYAKDINIYTSIIENALFCYIKVIKNSESISERQCAAIRMILLIDDNEWVMKGIARKFCEKHRQELFGFPFYDETYDYERDILKSIEKYCNKCSSTTCKQSYISHAEMQHFLSIKKSLDIPFDLFKNPTRLTKYPNQVFELFSEHITDIINTLYLRRITALLNN